MRILLHISLAYILFLPLSVIAQSDVASNVNIADSSTGRVVSGRVVSTGDSSAGAYIRNVLRGGGRAEVHIEVNTESDGTVTRESITKRFERGEKVDIRIGTSTSGTKARSEIRILSDDPVFMDTSSSARGTFFSWFDKYLPHASGTALLKGSASSSPRRVGEGGFSELFRRIVDKLLTFW